MTSSPELPVVVLHWRSPDTALRAVRSLNRSRGVRLRVLVVENGSGDGSGKRLRDGLDGAAELLELPGNLGYAGGMNAGIRWWRGRTQAPFILLVTQDMTLQEDAVSHLLAAAREQPGLAAVGPVTWLQDPPDRIFSAGGWIDEKRLRFGQHRTLGESAVVDWLNGCCLLLRTEALADVGLLDERYFLYLEEVDLCRRLTEAGWDVAVATEARARQERPLVPGAHYAYYMARNQYRFWRTHAGASSIRVALRLAVNLMGLLMWTVRGPRPGEARGGPGQVPLGLRLRRFRAGVAGLVGGTVDHFRGRTGPGGPSPS
jgi:GT2 family glycosyltransferase